jgi:hypothetical protein
VVLVLTVPADEVRSLTLVDGPVVGRVDTGFSDPALFAAYLFLRRTLQDPPPMLTFLAAAARHADEAASVISKYYTRETVVRKGFRA